MSRDNRTGRFVSNNRPPDLVRHDVDPSKFGRHKHPPIRIGDRFGELTVVGFWVGERGGIHGEKVQVQCSCGAPEHTANMSNLRAGRSTRCMRCALTKATHTRTKKYYRYADVCPDLEHRRRLLNRIAACIQRCTNPKYKAYTDYGGRGIRVYDDWVHNRRAFLQYLVALPGWDNPHLELDRINNDGNYEPGNLRFISRRGNIGNRRSMQVMQRELDCLRAEVEHLRARLRSAELRPPVPIHGLGMRRKRGYAAPDCS